MRSPNIASFRGKVHQANGYEILKDIGTSEAELKHVLSTDYDAIISRLQGDASQATFDRFDSSRHSDESTEKKATVTVSNSTPSRDPGATRSSLRRASQDQHLDGPPAKKRRG